jgi:peptidyl-prolyl cis-trans isomerase SurA
MYKKFFLFLICFSITLGIAWAQPEPASAPAQSAEPVVPLNRIVAIVNDEIISENDLDEAIEQLKQQLIETKATVPPAAALRDDALQQLINYRLQLQMAERAGVNPTPEEINRAIDQIAKSHQLTVDQLKEQLEQQHVSYSEFEKKMATQLKITQLQQQMVAGKIKVSAADIADYRKTEPGAREYKLVDFFLPLAEQPTEEELDHALTTAHQIQQELKAGTPIDHISIPYQDLGWRTPAELPQLFVDQLPQLTLQNASPPLRAPNGYHVLKLVETRSATQQLTDDQIRDILFRKQYEAAVKTAIDKVRREAYIQIIPE